jgi:hypothetical protein
MPARVITTTLKAAGLAGRQIGASLDIGQSTVVD